MPSAYDAPMRHFTPWSPKNDHRSCSPCRYAEGLPWPGHWCHKLELGRVHPCGQWEREPGADEADPMVAQSLEQTVNAKEEMLRHTPPATLIATGAINASATDYQGKIMATERAAAAPPPSVLCRRTVSSRLWAIVRVKLALLKAGEEKMGQL
jgi:hypothetical protein